MSKKVTNKYPQLQRSLNKGEQWTKKCPKCFYYMADEYELCDNCLFNELSIGVRGTSTGGCGCCSESCWTQDAVVSMLRAARGEVRVTYMDSEGWRK